jgi:hypothetical protein
MNKLEGEAYIRGSDRSYSHYLEIDLAEAEAFLKKHNKRILLHLPNGKIYHRALQKRKDGYALVVLSKTLLKELEAHPNDLIRYTITPDESEYGMIFPEEFAEVLAQEPEAKKLFEALNPGKKRGLLHYIDGGKSIDARIKKALEVAGKLLSNSLS